jgi:DDE superfamily endonuclease/Helix-turn-helix of DDE superfamily endonuclease
MLLGTRNVRQQQKNRAGHIIRASASSDMGSTSSTVELTESSATASEVNANCVDASADILPLTAFAIIILTLFIYARSLWNRCHELTRENCRLKVKLRYAEVKLASITRKSNPVDLLKSDSDIAFYTGIETKHIFQILHEFVAKLVRRRWRGFAYSHAMHGRKLLGSPKKFGPKPKLTSKEEFLLTLMKLRLGLLNRDLADRFNISSALCSKTIKTWLVAMRRSLGHLVFWPSKEQVTSTKPARFRNLPDIRAIIDCTELFIETPKDPALQCATWSEYKHHNTLKFLIAIAPNSAITFLSKCYCGRASDKAITLDSKFLDKLDMYDMLQADKGFNIASDCEARLVSLDVPPGKRGSPQLSVGACKKTKRIANQRILVEQVIRRVKTFRILQTELPISLVPCADDIVAVCAALSNLKKPIYSS